jgi:flagellar hook-associated protein 3 FlgL
MRVTANTFANTLVNQLGSLAVRQARLQSQAATGQRVRLPEDDPVALRRVLDLQTEFSTAGQYSRNIARQRELAQAAFSNIKALKSVSDRASEIATLADGLKSPEELQAYATEITELIKQAVTLMNSTNRGDALFGGTRTDQPPYVMTVDANGNVTGVTYQGNTTLTEAEIAEGVTIAGHSLGTNTSGSGPRGVVTDSRSGADLFNHLIALQDNLLAGDVAAIAATDRANLANDEDNILYHISANGAVQSRLETADALTSQRGLALEGQV